MAPKTNMAILKEFFENDGGRKLGMDEMKQLTAEDRKELSALARKALGYPAEEAN